MNRFVNRAILVFFVLALLFSINCDGKIYDNVPSFEDFEGCFQGADSEGQPIILTLSSPNTTTGGASTDVKGSFFFFDEDPNLWICYSLIGNFESLKKAELKTFLLEVVITLTRTEADGIVTMTMEFSDGSIVGPLVRMSDSFVDSVELFCPAICP